MFDEKTGDPGHDNTARRMNLNELEAIARAATPGPWQHLPYGGQNQNGDYSGGSVFDADGDYLLSEVSDAAGAHIATFDPPTVVALIAKLREAETVIAAALNHDPLHGRTEGLHCGGMAPCVRNVLATYKPTNQEGNRHEQV